MSDDDKSDFNSITGDVFNAAEKAMGPEAYAEHVRYHKAGADLAEEQVKSQIIQNEHLSEDQALHVRSVEHDLKMKEKSLEFIDSQIRLRVVGASAIAVTLLIVIVTVLLFFLTAWLA